VAGGLSAGRVQSVAVRLIVEREREINDFRPEEYWKINGYFTTLTEKAGSLAVEFQKWLDEPQDKDDRGRTNGRTIQERNEWLSRHSSFTAELIEIDGRKFKAEDIRMAIEAAGMAGFSVDERIEKENSDHKAGRILILKGHVSGGPEWLIKSIQTKRTKTKSNPPFITSTLQQAGANQLGFTAQTTMRLAQDLYEGVVVGDMGSIGLITYMRTDSTHLAQDAIHMARDYISKTFGDDYLPAKPNYFASSNKSAQEAHEAIRPTDVNITPEMTKSSLTNQQYRLYRIIWERFVACQMKEAQWDLTTAMISGMAEGKELIFKATGRILVFDGCYRVTGVPNSSEEAVLPGLRERQPLSAIKLDPYQNFTSYPPRYTEASLVKKLEAEGIGRPSTYASIIQVIQARKYVRKEQNRFYATDLGIVVTDKLIEAFPEIIQVGYTRDMEQQLDDIEDKHADWVQMLKRFYGPFKQSLKIAYQDMEHAKATTEPAPFKCPKCGGNTVYRFGKNGRFLSCANYPECKYAAPIDQKGNPVLPEQSDIACPKCGEPMLLRKGRFGPFLSCSKYPACDGIVNLDKKGFVMQPKIPPLLTDMECPKCGAPLNIRRGAKGPWLSCSKFPKCRGRKGWASLDKDVKARWEKALEEHEKANPVKTIMNLKFEPVGDSYKPNLLNVEGNRQDDVLDME
ncbi:MAG: type I DNA topoisomerase, partial [Deltaproteobacteria bacterium]|nr:type I DNA topoisomerase [Deltaproteobacteria bacterium]